MKKIFARDFCRVFIEVWNERIAMPDLAMDDHYASSSEFTQDILDRNGMLSMVCKKLSSLTEKPLFYTREWYTVDALFIGGEDTYGRELGYPSEIHTVIEHENASDVETEMWKLLHWRCPLKVLIFYDFNEANKAIRSRSVWLQEKLDALRKMYQAVDVFFPDAEGTEYLIIVGNRDEAGQIRWRQALAPDFDLKSIN